VEPIPARRLALQGALLALTFFTTTALGARLAHNFEANLPPFDLETDIYIFLAVWRKPALLLDGLPYSLTLLGILLAHEFGHYFACQYHQIRASLPYFLPIPLGFGTFGAFIRLRSAIRGRRALFDVGVAGPLAGMVATLPALGIGLALSRVAPGLSEQGDVSFGTPLLMRALEWFLFPGAEAGDINLHPVARAAWIGLLATSFNLLPVGQFDGGHLVYARFGEKHRWVALGTIVALLALWAVTLFHGWLLVALVMMWLGRKHFAVVDNTPLGRGRRALLALSALIFVVTFIPAPVQYNTGQGLWP
jgi:membrane-associated protease RseP (regulator of RpoE activity)